MFPKILRGLSTQYIVRTKRRIDKENATVDLQCVLYKLTYFP